MSDKDCEEYHNIGKAIKHSEKYRYQDATRIEEHGSRLYDVNGTRLPSVTTILGKTKDQQFIKDWKAKVGEQEAERIKNLSSNRGTAMHKFLEHYILGTGYDDLTELGQTAKPWPKKLLRWVLRQLKSGMALKLHYIILAFTLGLLISYVFTMV
jgi:genome maintenance exonuclease 1